MKCFLISDNTDTLAGMRLVGVGGVVVHTQQEMEDALKEAQRNEDMGLVLITSKLFRAHAQILFHYKLHWRRPLIVEMPDRHSGDNVADNIKRYIAEAVGMKL